MVRGTTPTFTFSCTGYTFPSSNVYVYIKQRNVEIKKTGTVTVDENPENCTVTVELTQEETLSLSSGPAEAQIRAINSDGTVVASETLNFLITKVLIPETLVYENEEE